MMVNFNSFELPVAYSMIKAAGRLKKGNDERRHPFNKYFYYWAGFNEIYSVISHTANQFNSLRFEANGQPKTKQNGSVRIPLLNPRISERVQIDLALAAFDNDLKHRLIIHPSTSFFLSRTPVWQNKPITNDAFEQKLNGVINVNDTVRVDYPVWSPIDIPAHHLYSSNSKDLVSQDLLAKQILDLLYTVRCNLTHGHKEYDDSNDVTVVENALPLLKMIVSAFTR